MCKRMFYSNSIMVLNRLSHTMVSYRHNCGWTIRNSLIILKRRSIVLKRYLNSHHRHRKFQVRNLIFLRLSEKFEIDADLMGSMPTFIRSTCPYGNDCMRNRWFNLYGLCVMVAGWISAIDHCSFHCFQQNIRPAAPTEKVLSKWRYSSVYMTITRPPIDPIAFGINHSAVVLWHHSYSQRSP